MGALTSNRKRGDDYFTLNYKNPNSDPPNFVFDRRFDSHISKKPRFSSSIDSSPERACSSKSAASRIYQYPEPIYQFRRQVHAPCRVPKFGLAVSLIRDCPPSTSGVRKEVLVDDEMGNLLGKQYEKFRSSALGSLRYCREEKQVIDVDEETETETVKDGVSEDSSIEEVEVLEDGHEGQSMVLDHRLRETNGVVSDLPELDGKVREPNVQPSSSSVISDSRNGNLKVESTGMMSGSLSLNRELSVPIHKRLLESVRRRAPKLSSLSFQIKLNEKLLEALQLLRPVTPVKKPEEDLLREPFIPLTEEEEAEVSRALSKFNRRKVLATHENSNIQITGEVLQCLRPGAWLNDEVINVYLELLKEREKREPKKFLKCHFFNTFFYKKLISGGRGGYDFRSVRRWTTQKKLGYCLLDCDKIFIPIHKEIHWCLAVINKKDEKFQYLDSLRGTDTRVLEVLARYFVDEVRDKSGTDIDVSSWEYEYVEDLPEQENGYDCGVFMVKYADFYSRGLGLCFNQEHMPYFRQRTAKEILRLKAE